MGSIRRLNKQLNEKVAMKHIKPSESIPQWPRAVVESVECRKRDLVIRITDWTSDKDEPAFDVECYIGGVYDWNESKCFTLLGQPKRTKAQAKQAAIDYAKAQIEKLL